MAIATQWVVSATAVTNSSTSIYTTVAATVSSYLRDLVITNGGTASVFIGFGGTAAAVASSFDIPAGGTVVLTQCQVPNATKIWGITSAGTVPVSVGYATNVAYV